MTFDDPFVRIVLVDRGRIVLDDRLCRRHAQEYADRGVYHVNWQKGERLTVTRQVEPHCDICDEDDHGAENEPWKIRGKHTTVSRDGTAKNYQLKVDGVSVGRVKKARSLDPVIGALHRSYHVTWNAKSGPYDQVMAFQTQQEAEDYLMARKKD
jgi:hypothetical protein